MKEKPDYRGLINPLSGFPELEQREIIAKFNPSDIYVIGRNIDHDAIVKAQRHPKAIVVAHTALAARQRGVKSTRYAYLLEFRDDIHSRGGFILEASTGLRSDRDWPKMREAALPILGRIAQGSRSAINGRRGTPPLSYNREQILTMLRIMADPKYKNWPMRKKALRDHDIDPVPSRTWIYENLNYIARDRGLLK